jgi:hypothetical protein
MMAALNEATYAAHLIRARKSGHSWSYFFRSNAWRYVRLLAVFGLALAFFGYIDMWSVFWLVTGMAAGVLLRDVGWVRSSQRAWPVSERIIDWEKVRQIAEGKDCTV